MKRTLTLAVIAALALSHETNPRFRGKVDVLKTREEPFRRVDHVLPHHSEENFDDESLFNMMEVRSHMRKLVNESNTRTDLSRTQGVHRLMEFEDNNLHKKSKDDKDKGQKEDDEVDRDRLKNLKDKFKGFDDVDDDELLNVLNLNLRDLIALQQHYQQVPTIAVLPGPKTQEQPPKNQGDTQGARKGYIDFEDDYFSHKSHESHEDHEDKKTRESNDSKKRRREYMNFDDGDSELNSLFGLKDLFTEGRNHKAQQAGIRG